MDEQAPGSGGPRGTGPHGEESARLRDSFGDIFRADARPPRRALAPEDQPTLIRHAGQDGFSAIDPDPEDVEPATEPDAEWSAADPDEDAAGSADADAGEQRDPQEPAGARRGVAARGAAAAGDQARHPFTRALLWTLAGGVLPGLGLVRTRLRWVGVAVLALFVVGLVSLGIWVASDPFEAAKVGTRPKTLRAISVALVVGALLWAGLILLTHVLVRPSVLSRLQRAVGAALVGILSFAVAAPMAVAASYSWEQASLINKVFGTNDKKKSQTRPVIDTHKKSVDVWKDHPRLNILLVGLDDNKGRKYAEQNIVNTDTMMVASINTQTGDMVLTQVPRIMARTPFPKGSKLAEAYPDGYYDGDALSDGSWASTIWSNVPSDHPELFEQSDYKGADALKMGMEGALGLKIDYFVALNIDGLVGLINAMGGVRLNVNTRIPIAGNTEGKAAEGYLEPGPDQKLNGYHAMWYARSRSESNDFDRMGRQSCVVKAIIDQADPQTMLTRYEAIAKASGTAVSTDIPSDLLPHLVDLSERVKDGKLDRVLFEDGKHGFLSANPDFAMIRRRVAAAIEAQGGPKPTTASPKPTAKPSQKQTSSAPTTSEPEQTSSDPDEGPSPSTTPAPAENLKDVCGYHPEQASEPPR